MGRLKIANVIVIDAQTACEMTNGALANPAHARTKFRGATNDTRSLKKGNAFFCLSGGSADGHQFAEKARDLGAGAIVADKTRATQWQHWSIPVIGVDDPLTALGDLACAYRKQFRTRYVAVTGSVGKTTTKELIAGALSAKFPVYKSPGNFNNLIGIPLALLSRPLLHTRKHDLAVLEFGMSTPGEIKRLVEIVEPSWGVVTRIGTAHLLQLKTVDAIAKAKRELFDYSDSRVVAILNSDDPRQRDWQSNWRRPTVTYGLDAANNPDFIAGDVVADQRGVTFRVNRRHEFRIALSGEYNVPNALAAIAVARHLGVPVSGIVDRLKRVRPVGDRSRIVRKSGVTLIADCYNANPTSMRAAIGSLLKFPNAGRRIAVLGAMRELGDGSDALHREIGEEAARLDIVFMVGKDAHAYRNGIANSSAEWIGASDRSNVTDLLKRTMRTGDVILFKGSHSEHLEEVVASLEKSLSHGRDKA